MTEFGHIGIIGNGFCLDKWGVGPFVMLWRGKKYRFEDSDRFGPVWIRKDGEPTVKQPDERSPFWEGYKAWREADRSTLFVTKEGA